MTPSPPAPRNIVLVGFMGTGKTTVGTIVAARLGMRFVDMDVVIEQREGRRIAQIFADSGEPYFRSLERALARELSGQAGLVIGTGGGIVLNAENIRDLGTTGVVICLTADPATIARRVAGNSDRPLLAGDDAMARIVRILGERAALYGAIADRIDTAPLSPEQVADRVVALHRTRTAQS